VEERVLNPEFIRWLAADQLVLQFLLNSLSREVLTQVAGMETSVQVWSALTGMYSSQSRPCIMQLRMQLAGTQKKELAIAEYVAKMKSLDTSQTYL
jgi:hypothetical protein